MIHVRGESFDARDGAAAIAVEPDSAVVTIPDAHFLFTADFKRKGSDLILTGEDGRKMLVPDYFRHEKHPDLISPEGALLSASLVELLSGSAAPGQYAQAGSPPPQQPIGRVETVMGSATAVRNGIAIELNVGDLVFQGDVVQTLSNSTLAIAFADGSAFTLNENARMALNEFVYDPNSTANSALINLVQGTVSFIAAQVAKTGNMRVETPTATLGIRGTFVTVSVSSTDGHTVASLGLETDQTTGQQFAGAFTLTNRITGNQVLVSQVNSMFAVSPTGTIAESPKPPGIAALEQATFQALVPVMQAAANFAGQTGPAQGQNQGPNQGPNQNTQDGPSGQKAGDQGPSNSSSPSPGGSSGANLLSDNKPLTDNKPTTINLAPQGPADNPPPQGPTNTPLTTTQNTVPVTPASDTSAHVTPTGSVIDVSDTETAGGRLGAFSLFEHVSIANPGSPTVFINGSATLLSATYAGGLPANLTTPSFLGSLLSIDPDGTVHYDTSKFNFLGAGQSLSYTIAFDVKSGTDTLHLTLNFTVNGTNEAPTITVGAGDAASATIIDKVGAATLAAGGTLSFKDVDSADGHSLAVAVKSGPAIGSFAAGVLADTTGSDSTAVGDILWAFAANKTHAQSLAAGEAETEVFTVTLSDGHGGTASQDVSVTVVGVNDAPVITSPDPHITRTETTTTGSSALQSGSGTLNFTDPDLNDVGYTVSLLGVSASGMTAGLPDTATLLSFLHADGVSKAAGSSQGTISGTFATPESTFDYLAAGETVTLTYTVQIADSHGGTGTQTVTVTVTGTNDAPVITGGPISATVQEDVTTRSFDNKLIMVDPDLSDTHTWTVVGGSTPHAPNYQFKIDEFKVVKTGTNAFTFDDQFNDGLPPPAVPSDSGAIQSYFVTGTISELDGKAVLVGPNSGFGTGSPPADPFFGQYATLNTNINPTDTTKGLKNNSNFTVEGLFDLTLPEEDRNGYGIRLTDRTSFQAGDSTVELRVGRGADGIERVQLREIDFASHITTVLQSFTLAPGSNDQIRLSLAYDIAQPGVVHASFTLKNGEVSTVTNFTATGAIFNNENWTRAQFFAEAPAQSDSVLQGTYGQLDITQAGAWTYQLANSQANVQALPAGQPPVQDIFTVQVADGHGGFDTKTITVNVVGTNDAPTINLGSTTASGAISELTGTTGSASFDQVGGTIAFKDVDLIDTHTVSQAAPTFVWSGGSLSSSQITALTNSSTLTLVKTDSTGSGSGSVAWNYKITDSALDFLAAGQTLTATYNVTVNDGHGGSVTQPVTVTVTGTNDAPTIAAGTNATGNVIAAAQEAPLTEVAQSYLTADHNLINGLDVTGGFGENDLAVGDDNSSSAIDIRPVFGTDGLNFFGQYYKFIYINNNGNITFNGPSSTFTPLTIDGGVNNPIIAPFWADVDTRGSGASATPGGNSTGANRVHYDLDSVNGVVTVTWDDVGYYGAHTNLLNAFQVQLISVGNGDFDIVYRYEDINWTTGDASGGSGGVGGTPARAGYSSGDGNAAHYFELSQSGNQAQMLALESTDGNTGIPGVEVFEVRGGNVTSTLTTSGTIQFADADLSDSHSVAVSLLSAARSGDGEIPAATQSDLLDALTTSMSAPTGHDSTGTGTGAIAWTFSLPNSDANFLAQNETLTVIYNVTIGDNHGGSVTQPVTVTITGANDAPTLAAVTGPTYTDTWASDDFSAASGTLAGSDVDSNATLTYGISDGISGSFVVGEATYDVSKTGAYGTLYVNSSTGAYTYVPDDGAINALTASTSENFTLTVSDDTASAQQTFTVTLNGANDAPVAVADTAAVTEDAESTSVSGNVLGNDTDVDTGDTHSVTAVNGSSDNVGQDIAGTYGTLHLNADGSYTYTLDNSNPSVQVLAEGEQVTDVFTYTNSDNHGGSSSATLTVTVTGTDEESLQETDWTAESGDWTTADNWSNGVPSSTIAAVIAASGYTVSLPHLEHRSGLFFDLERRHPQPQRRDAPGRIDQLGKLCPIGGSRHGVKSHQQ